LDKEGGSRRRGRARHYTARYSREKQSRKVRRAKGITVAFFSTTRAFVSSLEGAEAARERNSWTQLRIPLLQSSYVVLSCWNYTTAGCWAQSFDAGVTINDLIMARSHYRANWSSFTARRCGSTAHGLHHRSVRHTPAILLSSVIARGFALGFDRVRGFATLLCAVR